MLRCLGSPSQAEPLNYVGLSLSKEQVKVQHLISLCLQILWLISMFCFSMEKLILLKSLSLVKEWFPWGWHMPALPFLLWWGSWNRYRFVLAVFTPKMPMNRVRAPWAARLSWKAYKVEVRGKVPARAFMSSLMIRGMFLKCRNPLSLLLAQYASSISWLQVCWVWELFCHVQLQK